MKRVLLYGLICLTFFPLATKAKSSSRYLLVGGSGNNQVSIIDKTTLKELWSYPLEAGTECNSVDVTASGEILIAYRGGARLVNPENNTVVWDIKAPRTNELSSASVLPGGGFLLAWSGHPAEIMELDDTGKIRKTIPFDTGIDHLHSQFRQVIKNRKGNYLIPLMGKGLLVEIDGNGKQLSSVESGGNPFSALELKDGTIVVPCGDAHVVKQYRKGKEIRCLNQNDIEDISLLFVAEVAMCRNGNLLICNWSGHEADKDQPLVIELDAENRPVWVLPSGRGIGSVSTVKELTEKILNQKNILH